MAKAPSEVKGGDKKPAVETEGRKNNPWIPIAVIGFIVALIAVMAAMSNSSSNTTNTGTTTAASGTTQSGGTGSTATSGQTVDTSWITLDTTATQVAEQTGIPAKMLQQFLGITDADMGKPFSALGGDATVTNAQSLVAQFGGGAMTGGGTGSSGAPSGMGGTSTP
jgi:hypothetical protein